MNKQEIIKGSIAPLEHAKNNLKIFNNINKIMDNLKETTELK